jgi:alpha-ribazole phosphatase/probable phosphoglycerate mutase
MDTLLFIRHAETDLAGRFCGQSNPPVNERGHRQIESLLKALTNESIDSVYASDLSRSLVTAVAIGKAFKLLPVALPGLREIGFGEWEGLSWEEIEARDRAYAQQWSDEYPNLPAPGGEPFEAFRSRVLTQINFLLAMSAQRCGAVVTHAGVMRVVLRSLCGLGEQEAWEQSSAYCGFFRYQAGRLV